MLNDPSTTTTLNAKTAFTKTKGSSLVSDFSGAKLVKNHKEETATSAAPSEGVKLPVGLLKAIRRKSSSVGIGSSSSNGGSGNNSDNSGLISIGNNSFGFNFDNEETMLNNSSAISEAEVKVGEGDSDQAGVKERNIETTRRMPEISSVTSEGKCEDSKSTTSNEKEEGRSPLPTPCRKETRGSHEAAAATAVANLRSIASACSAQLKSSRESHSGSITELSGSKRRASDEAENDSGGYNSDDESSPSVQARNAKEKQIPDRTGSSSTGCSVISDTPEANAVKNKNKKPKLMDNQKREERNAREKERSFRISKQINELRNLLSSGGVIVPKGTKSSVLTEAANYIRMLQQHQYRSEIDRHQLIQQMQMIGGGALGTQAASAVRHVAAQNGVWSLGNFGGIPPRSAMKYYNQDSNEGGKDSSNATEQTHSKETAMARAIEEHEYRFVFNSCSVGMAIASMGGAFIDCNQLFCRLSNYSKQEVCSMTIFNLTSRQDLQHAFDLISHMISPPSDVRAQGNPKPCTLRGSMKDRDDLGLSVSLIKGDDGIAKCFCVTLVRNPSSPFDTSRPLPATSELMQEDSQSILQPDLKTGSPSKLASAPAYTAG